MSSLSKKARTIILSILTVVLSVSIFGAVKASAATTVIPDISEWQGKLTDSKVSNLKSQVSFIINRRQYGANYQDKYATNNTNLYVKYGIPFGEYDYATFTSAASARNEANVFFTSIPIKMPSSTYWTTKKMTSHPVPLTPLLKHGTIKCVRSPVRS